MNINFFEEAIRIVVDLAIYQIMFPLISFTCWA